MNSTVTPILALNLMSCTEPYMNIPTNHTFDEQFTPYNRDFVSPKDNYYYDNRRKSVGFPISKKEYINMVKRNTSTPTKKFNRNRNRNNSMYRKYHNIKQPGRTNCTQRLF